MGGDGTPRIQNMLFWPLLAMGVLALALANFTRVDKRFFLTPPIASFLAYMAFAAASIGWALAPDYSFSRFMLHMFAFIAIIVPYSLPISTKRTMEFLHLCCMIGIGVSAIYVLTTPSSPIGHPGYFTHKQELGVICGAAIILSAHEILFRGWRRWFALASIALTLWVIFESQSKSALAFMLISLTFGYFTLLVCKYLRTTPAFVIGAVVVGVIALSYVWSDPVGRIAWHLYGDSTLTGRTFIWDFINYIISQKTWFGWGFHSYWGVPNSPHNEAPGFIRDMVSTHSGYLELRLDTGRIGYWLFMVFIYASLHYLEPVRRKDPIRAWLFISIATYILLLNMLESIWINMNPLWIIYLIVVGESVQVARARDANSAARKDDGSSRRQPVLRGRPAALR